ncbi:hypothetical protein KR038_000401, partial [Drosophila bunnanda]
IIYESALRFVSLTAGCFYPAFVSCKLLNVYHKRLDDKEITDDIGIWLTYWIVYGVWSVIDFFTTGLGSCVPLLSEMKLVFVCWLLPSIGAGSQVVYDQFLNSFFSNNEVTIENILIHASLWFVDFLDRMLRTFLRYIMGVVDDYLLTRGLPRGPAIPTRPPRIDNYFAKMRLERKQKEAKTEDLANSIEKALGEETGNDDDILSINNSIELDKTDSDELVFSECYTKPKTLPKPIRRKRPALSKETMDIKAVLN